MEPRNPYKNPLYQKIDELTGILREENIIDLTKAMYLTGQANTTGVDTKLLNVLVELKNTGKLDDFLEKETNLNLLAEIISLSGNHKFLALINDKNKNNFIEKLKAVIADIPYWADQGKDIMNKKTPDSIVKYRKIVKELDIDEKIKKIYTLSCDKLKKEEKKGFFSSPASTSLIELHKLIKRNLEHLASNQDPFATLKMDVNVQKVKVKNHLNSSL